MEWIKKQCQQEKGFTLVEIIVVLVILAILAAFTIPTMLGFVEDAKAKAYIAEAREVYVAAQATAMEYIGTGQNLETTADFSLTSDALSSYWVSRADPNAAAASNPASLQMKKYLENDLKISTLTYEASEYSPGDSYWYVVMDYAAGKPGKVKEVYYAKNGYVVWFSEESVTVKKLEAPDKRPERNK